MNAFDHSARSVQPVAETMFPSTTSLPVDELAARGLDVGRERREGRHLAPADVAERRRHLHAVAHVPDRQVVVEEVRDDALHVGVAADHLRRPAAGDQHARRSAPARPPRRRGRRRGSRPAARRRCRRRPRSRGRRAGAACAAGRRRPRRSRPPEAGRACSRPRAPHRSPPSGSGRAACSSSRRPPGSRSEV